jgi:hypothetical protein
VDTLEVIGLNNYAPPLYSAVESGRLGLPLITGHSKETCHKGHVKSLLSPLFKGEEVCLVSPLVSPSGMVETPRLVGEGGSVSLKGDEEGFGALAVKPSFFHKRPCSEAPGYEC